MTDASAAPPLADLAWPAVPEAAHDAVLAVPVGAIEQHGPHLPLSTDTDLAVALVAALARRRRAVVAAPPVAYGASGEHQGFPGTISLGSAALEMLLVELGRSAAETFPRLLLVSAHGGNQDAVSRAARRLGEEGRAVLTWSPRWSGDAHAGRSETSLMLALDPARVRLSAAAAGETAPLERVLGRLRRDGVRAVSPNGVLGDPAGATAAEGRALLERETERLAAALDDWRAP